MNKYVCTDNQRNGEGNKVSEQINKSRQIDVETHKRTQIYTDDYR